MKILGLRNLFKSEILDFSLKFSKITIDTAILKDFSIGKGKPLIAKSQFYQLLTSTLPLSASPFPSPSKTLQFRKNHLQLLLFFLLQNRSKVRFNCVSILTTLINSQQYLDPVEVYSQLVEQEGMNE
jgi:hypothetical protein